ncbi:MAG: cytochrome ubiquinol oxidase subunit I [Actinocrinis sp.]
MSGLVVARVETALSLSFHILFAVFGVGLPWLVLYTERRWLKTGDRVWYVLTRKWARVMAVLFAIGAVSGTVLSFEFGLLWPTFMATYGGAIGLLFTLEAFAFFAEAIFMGLYLYGWKRLSPRAHWLVLWPIAISGTLSTLFIVMANAWMNNPVGIGESHGKITADPWRIFASSTSWTEVTHMAIAALMCTGGAVAAVYAVGMLRGRRDAYHRHGLNLGMATVLFLAPIQLLVGDFAARDVASTQPAKLAAMEAHYDTSSHVPLVVGGIYNPQTHHLTGGLSIPDGLSLLLRFQPGATVQGLDRTPANQQPMTAEVHLAFDSMVGLGSLILLIAAWGAWRWWRGRRRGVAPRIAHTRPWLLAAAFTGPAAMVAMLAGWEVTEGGRQPWIVYRKMLVTDAATKSTGLGWALLATILIYLGLAVALILILRRLATGAPPGLDGTGDAGPSTPPEGTRLDTGEPSPSAEPAPADPVEVAR